MSAFLKNIAGAVTVAAILAIAGAIANSVSNGWFIRALGGMTKPEIEAAIAAAVRAVPAIPAGAIVAFNLNECPTGWARKTAAGNDIFHTNSAIIDAPTFEKLAVEYATGLDIQEGGRSPVGKLSLKAYLYCLRR